MLKEFVAITLVLIAGIFFYVESGERIDPTLQIFEVSENWEDHGVIDNLNSNGLLYPDANQEGTWTSFPIDEESNRIVNLFVEGDSRDGTVNVTVNAWEGELVDEPDATYVFEMTNGLIDEDIEGAVDYDTFEVEIFMEEVSGSNNDRPNVNDLQVTFERDQGLGVAEFFLVVLVLGSLMVFYKRT